MTPPHPLRALIVDDEPPARLWLKTLLAYHPEITIIGEAADIDTATHIAHEQRPDILFLDIQIPPHSGFDLLPRLQTSPHIVFITAHDDYTIRAFEANALDYLLKPLHPERLAKTIRRILNRPPPSSTLSPPCEPSPPPHPLTPDDLIPLRDRSSLVIAPVHTITAIEAEGAYTRVFLQQHSPRFILRRLNEWEQLLPSPPFLRIERSLLVNLSRIQAITPCGRSGSQLLLQGHPEPILIPIGRRASNRLRTALFSSKRS